MKKIIRKYFILTLALSLLLCSSGLNVLASEITDAQNEKNELQKKKAETEQILAGLEDKKSDTLAYIEELDKQSNSLEKEIDRLQKEIASTQTSLKKTEAELVKAKEDEKSQYDSMKKRIQYMYMNGNSEYIEILMTSDSIADFLNKSEYVKKISEYDRDMLTRYQEAKQMVIDKETSLKAQKASLEKMNAKVEKEKQDVELLISEKNKEIEKYDKNIDKSSEQATAYAKEIAAQEKVIEDLLEKERKRIEEEERRRKAALEEAARKKQQNSSGKNEVDTNVNVSMSGFAWPLPASGRLTCGFGYRHAPTAGASTYHKGIDIGASSGSAIVATQAGTVVTASYGVASGNYVMIYHGDGVYSYYMHCSRLLVESGQSVKRGETIALVGSTGVSTGPHLHFAMTIDGTYVDPSNYVSY